MRKICHGRRTAVCYFYSIIAAVFLLCRSHAAEAPGETRTVVSLNNQSVTLTGSMQIHVTGAGDPILGCVFDFTSPDAWLFLENVAPSTVISTFTGRFRMNGVAAAPGENLRITRYDNGTVVIPQGREYGAMTVFGDPSLKGSTMPLQCNVPYDDAKLGTMKMAVRSFVLKRGYTATIAQNENGSGLSQNYVAQDHDLQINALPPGLDKNVRFIRIFPWRWTNKKGVAGDIWKKLNVGWYYDWNISQVSTPDLEYVPIRQNRYWPNLDKQDWAKIGSPHLLGFNEPDHKDQSNMTVDEAIAAWPDLLATGLRLGSPAVSDGGLKWLYEFMDKARAAHLRVDFIAVHYYRSFSNPGDPQGAANQFYKYLKEIHDKTGLPIWVTEFNNGADWTHDPKPTIAQEKATIAAFVEMLDRTPFVERYAIYNWVEDVRRMQLREKEDGPLTPAGEAYRDEVSPLSYLQTEH